MSDETRRVRGGDLRVGDTIEVWWSGKRDTITAFRPYNGPLAHLWPAGVRIAEFALCRGGMTIGNDDVEVLVARVQP
jgi:hypothetical protein